MTITESRNPERSKQPALNAMTVDVEDYFQVSAFDRYIDRADWKNYQSRVERNTQKLLRLFSEADIQATFFTLGWVAEKFPMLIRQIVDNGHELASHGWDHRMVTGLSANEFREDIRQAKTTLEQVSGTHISGYRAPSYRVLLDLDTRQPKVS